MTQRIEEILKPIVTAFVADLRGHYVDHCSDAMLVALLMWRLQQPPHGRSISAGQLIVDGDVNAAYEAAQPIFESILEHQVYAGGNGHHRAQQFSAFVTKALTPTKP